MIGPAFCSALYYLLYLHVEAFFGVIVKVMKKRLGTPFGMIWISIGLTILYNIVWNHMLAMLVKAGGPTELAVRNITFSISNLMSFLEHRTLKSFDSTTSSEKPGRSSNLRLKEAVAQLEAAPPAVTLTTMTIGL